MKFKREIQKGQKPDNKILKQFENYRLIEVYVPYQAKLVLEAKEVDSMGTIYYSVYCEQQEIHQYSTNSYTTKIINCLLGLLKESCK